MTTMRNFDTVLDIKGVTRILVSETLDITVVRPNESHEHLGVDSADWGWRELRDYVITELNSHFGLIDRSSAVKESGIFKSFSSRWGAQAGPIAQYVFDVCDGYWRGTRVDINRFCKGSDPYFATPISERLVVR